MDDVTIITIMTIGCGFMGVVLRYLFKSKCDQVNCLWGCLKIHREVEMEGKDDGSQTQGTPNNV